MGGPRARTTPNLPVGYPSAGRAPITLYRCNGSRRGRMGIASSSGCRPRRDAPRTQRLR